MYLSRRKAVQTLTAGAGALLLSPNSLFASSRRDPKKLGVALVGLGYYSTDLLAPALQNTQHCYLAGIVTGTPAKAEKWQKKYGIPPKNIYNYQNFDTIADNKDIDVVYVVLPPSMHHEYVVRAARAGKHVWCEKPMAITATECQEMIDECKRNDRYLSIGYRCQHEPNTIAYRKIVNDRLLGSVKNISCAAGYFDGRTNHWKQKKEMGGGALYDMGVYAIQGARLGSGMEPIAISNAKTSTSRPDIYKNGLDETTVARLEFPNQVYADIKTSFGESLNDLTISCAKGDIAMSPFQAYAGIRGSSPLGEINHPYEVTWQQTRQMDNDALAIVNKQPVKVPGEEGWRDIRIVEAIYRSAAEGGKRILLA